MKDYRMSVKLKNNRLLSAIEMAGFKSPMEFAEIEKINITLVYNLINMKDAPTNSQGKLRKWIPEICEALGVLPEEIFSEQQMYDPIEKNHFDFEMDKPELEALMSPYGEYNMEEYFERLDLEKNVKEAIGKIRERDQKIIKRRFGIGGRDEETLDDIAEEFDVTRERIRQGESRGLRELRHHKISGHLK